VILKYLHIGCAILSFAGFVVRGIWMWRGSPWLTRRSVRVVPHIIDTLLLASAVGLALTLRQYPLTHDWLTAKVVALPVYIVLGMAALRFGPTRTVRLAAWLAALAVFLYIVGVALSRSPTFSLI
jgi:uncharacterized membrane protein SirB2